MANMRTQGLPNPCRHGGPQCSAAGQNETWPGYGHSGYLIPAVSGVPNALHGDKIRNGPHVGTVATSPVPSRGSPMLCTGTKSEMAHRWAQWLPNPCRLGGPQCSAPGQNQKWPTCGHSGYLTRAVSGVPNALHEDIIRNGEHARKVTTKPLPSAKSAMLCTHGGRRQPMCDPEGCLTVWGAVGGGGDPTPLRRRGGGGPHPTPFVNPNPAERGTESEVAHKWARWLHNPCRLGGPHRFRAGGRIRGGPQVGKVAT